MKSILVLSFVGVSHAWRPDNSAHLKEKVNQCLQDANDDGSECYACNHGDIVSTSTASCTDGSTPQFISDWDTSLVTSFKDLFKWKSSFDQDLRKWDTSGVTSMSGTFWSASSFTNKGQPLLWDTSKVTDLYLTFYGTKFNQCLCNWDISKVTNMEGTFSSNSVFNQDLSCWDISNVDSIRGIFQSNTGMDVTLNWDINRFEPFYRENWDQSTNIQIDTSHNPTPCVASVTCNSFTCEDPKEINPDAIVPQGSDPSSSICCIDTTPCEENHHVVGNVCTACVAGKTRAAGDDPTGEDTTCDPKLCQEDHHVVNHACQPCALGTRPAGDDASGDDTQCEVGPCGGLTCVRGTCVNDVCDCPVGFQWHDMQQGHDGEWPAAVFGKQEEISSIQRRHQKGSKRRKVLHKGYS